MVGKPFVYTLETKMLGVASTTGSIPNHGVTELSAASTYSLDAPREGVTKMLFRKGGTTHAIVVDGGTGVSFNTAGGAQNLTFGGSTVAAIGDQYISLLGLGSTRWLITGNFPGATTAGVVVST